MPACPLALIEDSSGAGDVFCAGLIDALVRGLSVSGAVEFGASHAARFLADRTRFFEAIPLEPPVLP
jgi:sugar/nucleoside kinase (ribokinase family)